MFRNEFKINNPNEKNQIYMYKREDEKQIWNKDHNDNHCINRFQTKNRHADYRMLRASNPMIQI